MKNRLTLIAAIAAAGLIASVAQATTVGEHQLPIHTTTTTVGVDAAANAAANAKAAADLKAQQDLKATQDLKAQQDLKAAQDLKANQNLTGTVNGTAATTSGPASTIGGNAGGGSANTNGGNAQSTSGPASSNSGPASSVSGPASTTGGNVASTSGPANTTGGNAATTGGSANTASGPANTTGGAVKTDVGVGVGVNAGVKQNVDGSAGGNTLKTGDSNANLDLKNVGNAAGGTGYGGTGGNTGAISVAPKVDVGTKVDTKVTGANTGTNQLDSKVSGSNTGTFQNDGKQTTTVGPNTSTSSGGNVAGSGNSNVKVDTKGGAGGTVKDVGNGNGSGNTLKNGDATANGNGAGNTTNVNTSTTNVQPVQVPVLFNPLPPLVTAAGSLITERLACGPLQQVVKTKVYGTQVGIFKNTSIDLGSDYELAPVFEADGKQRYYNEREFMESGEKVVRRFGNQAIVVTALPNVSGASTLSIGFAGTNGGGNGGGGSSSAMSRIVTKITMSDCELPGAYKMVRVATVAPKPVVAATPAPQLTRDDILGALSVLNNLKLDVTVPTDRVESVRVGCKVEEFTDAAGKKVSMCRGSSSGSYGVTKVVKDSVTIRGELHSGASAKK